MTFDVVEKVFKKDRWYAKINGQYRGMRVVPYAIVVWLENNPAFSSIPKGYVVHHLDHNELNDDISNLALMQKFHHIAHHAKSKSVNAKVNIKETTLSRNVYYPHRKPTPGKMKSSTGKYQFFITVYEKIDGKSNRTRLYRWGGKKFRSYADADAASSELWEQFKPESVTNS